MSSYPCSFTCTNSGHTQRQIYLHCCSEYSWTIRHDDFSMETWTLNDKWNSCFFVFRQARSYLPVLFSGLLAPDRLKLPPIDRDEVRVWRAEQPVKIPSYLVAIAAGNLVFRSMGKVISWALCMLTLCWDPSDWTRRVFTAMNHHVSAHRRMGRPRNYWCGVRGVCRFDWTLCRCGGKDCRSRLWLEPLWCPCPSALISLWWNGKCE